MIFRGCFVQNINPATARNIFSKSTAIELIVILVLSVAVFGLSAYYDVLEYIVYYSDKYETLELDEIVPVMFFLVFALSVSLARRWRDLALQNRTLNEALSEVKQLRGILPICAYCHKIRNDKEMWQGLERYISQHSNAQFTHSICPECFDLEVKKLDEFEDDRQVGI